MIDACEVIDQSGYLRAWREAAASLRRGPVPPPLSDAWQTLNDPGTESLSPLKAAQMLVLKRQGLTLDQVFVRLRDVMAE